MSFSLKLRLIDGRYGIARLAPDAPVPDWIDDPGFSSVSRADDEITAVCLEHRIPTDIEADLGWTCLRHCRAVRLSGGRNCANLDTAAIGQ